MKKVMIIGWDCASPDVVFNKALEYLPNVKRIMEEGYHNQLMSCHPPITIPAWQVMLTGRSPGELGLYGFRHRIDNSYSDFSIASSDKVRHPRIWDVAARYGAPCILSGIPPSYPAFQVNGKLISCFLAPDSGSEYTYPPELKFELEKKFGDYIFDVPFRSDDKMRLKKEIFEMTDKHFRVFEYLVKKNKWNFSMHVEIGLDRVQHAFWRYFDRSHHLYENSPVFKDVIVDYYRMLDSWLGKFMQLIDDETLLLVASDHGAKPMKGAFCVNQWLEKEGYLVLKKKPKKGEKLQSHIVDWSKTKAWGWGGYYSRIFFNVKGREAKGIIDKGDVHTHIESLKAKIADLKGPKGELWNNRAYTPKELYGNPKGNISDLMVYWDDLSWRAAGTMGHESLYLLENDTGLDDDVHDWKGVIMAWGKDADISDIRIDNIEDVFGRTLDYMGVAHDPDIQGGF